VTDLRFTLVRHLPPSTATRSPFTFPSIRQLSCRQCTCACLPDTVHSFLHIMILIFLVLSLPLLALTAAVLPPGSPSSSPSFSSALSPSYTSPQTQQDMDTLLQRRLGFISASATMVSHIASWYVPTFVPRTHLTPYHRLQTLGPDGSWPAAEIDYTSGCPAQRANWPASTHWTRIRTYFGHISSQFLTQYSDHDRRLAWWA
jgi:hypothetical protein